LVGSAFARKYKKLVITAGRRNCDVTIDLTEKEKVEKTISETSADTVINFAAYTDVDKAEEQKNNYQKPVYY